MSETANEFRLKGYGIHLLVISKQRKLTQSQTFNRE